MICANDYPTRCAQKCIEELQFQVLLLCLLLLNLYVLWQFTSKYGREICTAKENSLSKSFSPVFDTLMKKYENPSEHDATNKALSKITEVKNIMHDTIAITLQSTTKLESIANTTGSDGFINFCFTISATIFISLCS